MKKLFLVVLVLSLSLCALAQKTPQDYVGRYDLFAGFSYLDSPKLGLQQNGVNVQAGIHLRRWLVFGADYSVQFGQASLVTADLKPNLQTLLVGMVGPTYAAALRVPFDATTQTFTVGPQLVFPRYKKFVFFAHPSIGAIHENISLNASAGTPQPIASMVVQGLVANHILSTTKPNDTTYFYGAGGGADYILSQHWRLRGDFEFVHVFLYSDLLKDSRNTIRLSFGPAYNFGPALKK